MRTRSPWWILVAIGVFAAAVLTLTAVSMVIWPGEAKLLAPLFCDDAQPDAFVVADHYSPQPGETSTDFTMYCMGPRGDHTDVGWLKPFLGISVLNGIVLALVLGALSLRHGVRRRRRRAAEEPVAEPRPFVSTATIPRLRRPTDDLPPGIISTSDAAPTDDDVS